jgi:hypothetical protein
LPHFFVIIRKFRSQILFGGKSYVDDLTCVGSVDGGLESENWLITREGLKGKYTVLGPDKHRYEAEFLGDDGKKHRWHFTAERK